MSSNALQYDSQEASRHEEFHGAEGATAIQKVIVILQVCIRCGQEFAFKQGRKSCPHCSGLLIAKTMVRRQT